MKAVIISGSAHNIADVYSDESRRKIAQIAELLPDCTSEEELIRRDDLRDADIVFSTWGMLRLTEEKIKAYLPKLRALFYSAGTVQYFARPFINCGIRVFSAWAANGVPVCEVTFSEIMLADKGFFMRRVRSRGQWTNKDEDKRYPGNYHTKVGIIGCGMIGSGVIERLKRTDMDVYLYDPFVSDERAAQLGAKKATLEEIFSECHIISNHVANKPETVGMLDAHLFDLMDKYAVFINTGRGAQIVEKDLIAALKNVPTRFALLDVTDPCEPPADDSELYALDNVYLTPHIAGSIGYETHRMAEYMINECTAYLGGQPVKYEVTAALLERMA
ncbi:MAG: hydroxyacid dehydrogenase [Clostridia bacterium]|nr:hydroxyacid dehydrogenase [Clostridia bacterium]